MTPATFVIVVARNEQDRIADTLGALARAFPGETLLLADDASSDRTPRIASGLGVRVISAGSHAGKGAAATQAVRQALAESADDTREREQPPRQDPATKRPEPGADEPVFVICDGDLGESAAALDALAAAVREGAADLAVAAFATRVGGGFGLALAVARWAIRRRCGFDAAAPLSGQRALRAGVLHDVLPFAEGFGMEVGMTIDAVRAGHTVLELELDLAHRASGRSAAGFVHRGRQLLDVLRAYRARGPRAGRPPLP
jgi:glycosyltransferase involved in cell wall biosynthesis